jgi:uncharacterized membrane protein
MEVSINNTGRVALSVACLLFTAAIFVHLTFYGNPSNALHLWAQSATFVATILIVGCLSGFSAVSALATAIIKK